MKKTYLSILVALMALTSCDNYLDITPKGQTLLNSLNDLEMLASCDCSNSAWSCEEMEVLVNDVYGSTRSFMTNVASPNTVAHALLTYDESVDRAALTENDYAYSRDYSEIARLNQVINTVSSVEGAEARKAHLESIAKVKRAYFHYLMVVRFCKQYDEATAANEGGIPYVTVINPSEQNQKLTLAETYEKLLADCSDEVLEKINNEPTNVLLPGKAFGYAVRAKILLQMKNYSEALKYANLSLKYNSSVEDLRYVVSAPTTFVREVQNDQNIFYAEAVSSGAGTYYITDETVSLFEDGDILKDYAIYSQTETKTTYVWNKTAVAGLADSLYCWSAGNHCRYNSCGVTSEQMHYIAAECDIRTGKIKEGLDLINKVRQYRIDPAKYAALTASTEKDAMKILQRCKRIECLFTYNNYADMKRWNTEADYTRTITRNLNGEKYTLSPTSPLWVSPFPKSATQYNNSLTQNY